MIKKVIFVQIAKIVSLVRVEKVFLVLKLKKFSILKKNSSKNSRYRPANNTVNLPSGYAIVQKEIPRFKLRREMSHIESIFLKIILKIKKKSDPRLFYHKFSRM